MCRVDNLYDTVVLLGSFHVNKIDIPEIDTEWYAPCAAQKLSAADLLLSSASGENRSCILACMTCRKIRMPMEM